MSGERLLWQTVVLLALSEALTSQVVRISDGNAGRVTPIDKRRAHEWIMGNGRDYRMVCSLSGIDPDMLRDRYAAGQINAAVLKNVALVAGKGEAA